MKSKKYIILLLILFATPFVFGADEINKTYFKGVAIDGYDPVSYFTEGKAQEGDEKHELTYKDAKWWFTSKKNLELFRKSPTKYAPQYGGYCAWAVAQGDTAGIDPDSWKIVDGKLYLNYNKSIQTKWEKAIPSNIQKADKNWPKVIK